MSDVDLAFLDAQYAANAVENIPAWVVHADIQMLIKEVRDYHEEAKAREKALASIPLPANSGRIRSVLNYDRAIAGELIEEAGSRDV